MQIETVHRLSGFGAVIAVKAYGTSPEGLAAEWRMIQLPVVDGDRIDRCEIFDDVDLDAALARFDESSGRPRCSRMPRRGPGRVWLMRSTAATWLASSP